MQVCLGRKLWPSNQMLGTQYLQQPEGVVDLLYEVNLFSSHLTKHQLSAHYLMVTITEVTDPFPS